MIRAFNRPENYDGSHIQIAITSDVISEGITLKDVMNVHILTPWWNYGKIEQTIGRAKRLNSHEV